MRLTNWAKALGLATVTAMLFSTASIAVAQVTNNNSCLDPNYIAQFNTLYRQWNIGLVDHFYTNNATETASGYVSETAAGSVIKSQATGTIPLYRYYSGQLSDHFYSTSAVTPAGYVGEGIVGYIFPTQVPGSTPLYRSYRHINSSPPNGDHLYTISSAERDSAAQYGYTFESIEGYVCGTPQ